MHVQSNQPNTNKRLKRVSSRDAYRRIDPELSALVLDLHQALLSTRPAASSEVSLYAVEIPAGVKPLESFDTNLDGDIVTLTCQPGQKPGDIVRVKVRRSFRGPRRPSSRWVSGTDVDTPDTPGGLDEIAE